MLCILFENCTNLHIWVLFHFSLWPMIYCVWYHILSSGCIWRMWKLVEKMNDVLAWRCPKKKQVLGPGIRTNEVFMHQTAIFDTRERIQGSNKVSSLFPCTCLLSAMWILIGSDNFQLINGEAYIYCFILAALLLLLATGTSLSVSYSSNCIFLWVIATIDVFITSNTNMEALAFLHLSDF